MKNLKIVTRIALGFSIVLLISAAIILPVVLDKISDVITMSEERELHQLVTSAKAELASEGRLAEALSAVVANMTSVQARFAAQDRDWMASEMVPTFKYMKEHYAARQFQFHKPPAFSFLRLHKPQKFGDDLSGFRKTVVATNTDKKPVQGLEKGVAGIGIRGITPVFHQGQHLGSVEFGMSLGQPFFDQFKKKYDVDIALYVTEGDGFKTFASTSKAGMQLSLEQARSIMGGKVEKRHTELNDTPYTIYGERITDFSGKPIGVMEITFDRSPFEAAYNSARNTTLGFMLLSLLIGLGLALLIARGITRPLCVAVEAMDDIAQGEGDLTKRLNEEGKNEIARLAAAFNRFAEKIQGLIIEISSSTTNLTAAAEHVSNITVQTNEGIQQQQMETDQVATAMNEMTSTVQEVAHNATQAAQATHQANEEANTGRQVVQQTISVIQGLASEVNNAANVIQQLEQEGENIGTVLDVIKSIAEQTNLLALNAAIEAARAGEQGRGFAVVADEVRTLASRTQQSTQEIQEMIERLQSGTKNAVTAMGAGSEQAKNGVEQAMQAGQSLDSIARSVTTINDMNTQIASAAEEQNAVAEEMNRNIVAINQVADNTAMGAQQTAEASRELAQLAEQLQRLVGQFRV